MTKRTWFNAFVIVAMLTGLLPAMATAHEQPAAPPVQEQPPVVETALDLQAPPAQVEGGSIEGVSWRYTFSSTVGTYTPIISGTVHGTASNDDTSFPAIPIGFTFRYDGVDYTQVGIQSNGWIAMGGGAMTSSYYPLSTGTMNNVISALGRDLQGNGTTSELRSETIGTAPYRVFVVQWTDYKRYGSAYNGDAFDFQIRLYETTNVIEIVYGEFTVVYVASPPYGPQVGLRGATNADFNNRKTDATHFWTNSLPGTTNADSMDLNDVVFPPNGLTYRWDFATGLFLDPPSQTGSDCRGSDVVYNVEVINQTGTAQSFNLSYSGNAWPTSGPATTGVIPDQGSEVISVTVHIPWATNPGDSDTLTIDVADPTNTYTDTATVTTISALANDWQDYANMPVGREVRAPSVVYYDGKMYVIGGYGYVSGSGAARPWLSIYDIATDSWSTGADMPAGRYWLDCEQLFDPNDNNKPKIYCAGGYLSSAQNTLYIYDIQNDSWSTGPTLPANRYNYASVKLDNKYYVIGGYTTSYSAEMLVYDPATNAWSTLAPMNTARRYFHAGVIGGKIYVAGGYNLSYLSSAEVYDPATNAWNYVAAMPTPWVNGADGVKHDRFLVIAGGSPSSTFGASNGALVYDAVTDTWDWLPLLDHLIYGAEGDTDGDGEFWYVTGRMYEGGVFNNSPYTTKLIQCAACTPVSGADFTVNPSSPRPGIPATFAGSVTGGSAPITYAWDFGDGDYGSGQTIQHAYATTGTFTVVMTATNCDGANWVTATHDVVVEAGPLIVVDPLALESTQCPDCVTTQTLTICNDGDQPLVYTITEALTTLLAGPRAGIESLSGSYVAFDPSVGGDACFETGQSQTFCFRAESFTNDWEYVSDFFQKFPTDWTVSSVYVQGTPSCTGGGTFGAFTWGFQTSPYEVHILHDRDHANVDHCTAYYCFDVTSGTGTPNALESWYWHGDMYGSTPHRVCSADGYTPSGWTACEEAINPQASIPFCVPDVIPWLGEDPATGAVPSGQCQEVEIAFDSTGLSPDTYTGTLRIASNDAQTPLVNVPVTLTVAGGPTNADFTWEPDPAILNTPVTFHGAADSLVPVDYAWDFGDGNLGSGQDPTHTYTTWGDFTVVMTATACGQTDVATHTVTVLPCWSVLTEHFEGTFPPAGWNVVNNGGNCVWQRNDFWATPRPNYAGGQGFAADADSDKCGLGTTMDTELQTMVLDLTGLTTATLRYMTAYNDIGPGGDYADTDISTDGGATWTTLQRWDEDHNPNGPGELVELDLTPYAGQSNVMVRFHYWIATYDWWWLVDQVNVFGCYVPGAVPDIDVTPASLDQVLNPDQTADQTVNIANLDIGTLSWTADVGCGTPVSWLSVDPVTGTVPGLNNTAVTVTFDSTGLALGFYDTHICINSNDPDEPTVQITVTLEVTGTPDIAVDAPPLETALCPDSTDVITFTICNVGEAALTWNLAEQPGLVLNGWKPTALPRPASVYNPQAVADLASADVAVAAASPVAPATWQVPNAVLWDNGPLTTHPAGCGATDASRLQTSLGMNALGFGNQFSLGYRMADDFTISDPAGWQIDTITFFAYQTGAPSSPSPITGVYLQIWDGSPDNPASNVVWGDLVTNRLIATTFSGIQRDSETTTCANNRYIFANTAGVGVALPPGQYWLDWMTDGSGSYSGPWAPPVTILGQTTTGDAYQYTGSWAPALDSGTATQQGMPFIIEGEALFDALWLSEAPITGTVLPGECQEIQVTFDSTGLSAGDYFANLLIASNDPDEPEITLPVTLTVKAPVADADFDWTPAVPMVGEEVNFDGTATGDGLAYAWAFGDGEFGAGENPTHTYAAAGDYTVVMTVTGDCGEAQVVSKTLTVEALSQVTFVYHDLEDVVQSGERVWLVGGFTGWMAHPVTMTANAEYSVFTATVDVANGSYDYKYYMPDLPDWSNYDMLNTADRNITVAGDATVHDYRKVDVGWAHLGDPTVVTITLGENSGNLIGEVYIQNVTNPTGEGRGVRAQLGYGSGSNPWTWVEMSPTGYNGNNTLFAAVITPTAVGVYTYGVRFDGNWGAGNPNAGWTEGDRLGKLTVEKPCAPVDITAVATNSPVTLGEAMLFTPTVTGDAPISYLWEFGDGVTSTLEAPSHVYEIAGTFRVTLTVSNECPSSDVYVLTVEVLPQPCVPLESITIAGATSGYPGVYTFTTSYLPADATLPIEYLWDNGDTTANTTRMLSVGTHMLTVTATNCTNAVVTDTHTIVIEPTPVCTQVAGVDLSVTTAGTIYTDTLVGFSADLLPADAKAPFHYRITIDGVAGAVMQSNTRPITFEHTFATTGTHTVKIAVWNCTMSEADAVTDTVELTVYAKGVCVPLESVTIAGATSGYPGVYTFTTSYLPTNATLPIEYLWDNGDTTANTTRLLSVGTHTLTVTATNCVNVQVVDTHVITIIYPYRLYLPVVMKNH